MSSEDTNFKCRFCGQPIWFDPKRKTQYGKSIPLDLGTKVGHDCRFYTEVPGRYNVSYRRQPYSYYFPCKFCGRDIFFQKGLRAKVSHKPIPIDRATRIFHVCPARHYSNKKKL